MPHFRPIVALMAFLILLSTSFTTGTPIASTSNSFIEPSMAPPACTGKDGCVNYAHRRCGDPFASGSCVNG